MNKLRLSKFEEKVIEHILKTPAPGKHSARSALRHIERAWEISETMPELALFSAITAEEESATAIFHSLNRRKYVNASSLKPKNHIHKTALYPFLFTVTSYFSLIKDSYNFKLEFNTKLSPKNEELLRIRIQPKNVKNKENWIYPFPPLDFKHKLNGREYSFEEELKELATKNNVDNIFKYIKDLANLRNKLLYSSQNGIPHVQGGIEQILHKQEVVIFHFAVYLLIDQYSDQQFFVQHALNIFLKILRRD